MGKRKGSTWVWVGGGGKGDTLLIERMAIGEGHLTGKDRKKLGRPKWIGPRKRG